MNKRRIDPNGFLSFSLLFCTLPFLIETSWHHYFIFLPFVQTALFGITERNWLRLLVIASMILSSTFIINLFPVWEDYTKWGFSFLANTLILFVVYKLAGEKVRGSQGAETSPDQ